MHEYKCDKCGKEIDLGTKTSLNIDTIKWWKEYDLCYECSEKIAKWFKPKNKEYKKIKIIDIFTMIANGEQPPRKIRYDMLSKEYQILIYAPEEQEYRFENDLDNIWTVPNHHLKDTVEILEG